ncbi:M48 family metallopeptidase [Neisseriaceae bacterium TC5R-5]|nr:M48 family metallopeptidase [Neisseriaceae bacterium TC5R-5]
MKKLVLAIIAATCFSAPVYAFDLNSMISAGSDALKAATLSDADVKAMASQARAELDKTNKVAPANSTYAKRLAKITKGLNSEDGTPLNFKVYLSPEINAFAMADGTVRVYSGLMDKMNDDEVRFVIGHEIGHVKLGHTKKAMQVAAATSAGRKAAAGSGSEVAAVLSKSEIGEFAQKLVNAQFSQSQESDADAYGLKFLKRNNYKLEAGPAALRKLAELSGGSDEKSMLSSHPAPGERAVALEKQIQKL